MSSDANDRPDVTENQPEAPQTQAEPQTPDASTDAAEQEQERARRRILVGSQRDPAAYRPKPKQRDWIPSSEREKDKDRGQKPAPEPQPGKPAPAEPTASAPPAMPATPIAPPAPVAETPVAAVPAVEQPVVPVQPTPPVTAAPPAPVAPPVPPAAAAAPIAAAPQPAVPAPTTPTPAGPREPQAEEPRGEEDRGRRGRRGRFRGDDADKKKHAQMAELAELMAPRRLPRPSVREQLSAEQEAELQEAMGGTSMEEMFSGTTGATQGDALEPESRHKGRVVAVQREDVFLELGGREQGILPVNSFAEPPEVGAEIEVTILRYKADEGLYELMLPGTAASVADWSQLSEGMLVEARVTGHNTGGLECEVNHIRGFIPISQISLYRVENLEEFLNQGMLCLVTEANPYRKNLVLSRRAVLEREKEEAKQKLLESLAPGQIHEGVVRKIMDFGAFVELGNGVDGLLHVSQLGWGRVKHPTDVVAEGQHIRVRIDKVDHETGRISLAYRDLMDNPWDSVDSKYLPNTPVHGKVVKLMEFGAFVELEPGVEGLVHISELAHKRVLRVSDVLKEGDEVDVMVLSVDRESRRISLSRKNVLPPPEPEVRPEAAAQPGSKPQEPAVEPPKPKKPSGPLKGGLERSPGADRFGLKW